MSISSKTSQKRSNPTKEKTDYYFVSKEIGLLAKKAKSLIPRNHNAFKIANHRSYRPVDYHRCAEFFGVLKFLEIKPGDIILDIGSPQWFSLLLARLHPYNEFHYINILPEEITPFDYIARICQITNIAYHLSDARNLPFTNKIFDKVISISVIEHIYPAIGGDNQALQEIRRVIKSEGDLLISLPYKNKSNILYTRKPVFERKENGRKFYARLYDKETLTTAINNNGFMVRKKNYISEKWELHPPGRKNHKIKKIYRKVLQSLH